MQSVQLATRQSKCFAQLLNLLGISGRRDTAEATSGESNEMGSEALSFKVGHTYNLHNGHEYFTVVAISAQFATLQRVPPAGWDDERIKLCGRQFRPFRRKIRHDFYKCGVDSVTFGYNTVFADEEVPRGKPFVPRLVRLDRK